jgi:hypothetical protein
VLPAPRGDRYTPDTSLLCSASRRAQIVSRSTAPITRIGSERSTPSTKTLVLPAPRPNPTLRSIAMVWCPSYCNPQSAEALLSLRSEGGGVMRAASIWSMSAINRSIRQCERQLRTVLSCQAQSQ